MSQTLNFVEVLRRAVRPTTFVQSRNLSRLAGANVVIASETFQHTGSFKFRAAYNVAQQTEAPHLIAASSGNFGQALACACQLLGKKCTVVMPGTSAQVKIDAVAGYGGVVDIVDTTRISRAERVTQLALEHPDAQVVSAYDDQLVIDGNSSLGEELVESGHKFDAVIVPVGGGGLASGIIRALQRHHDHTPVFGAEPQMANDASRSLQKGEIIRNESEPQSIADGARTLSVGLNNWPILQSGLRTIIEVDEAAIEDAVRILFTAANLKVEPTGALAVAALLSKKDWFADQTVCCIASGGNVDAEVYRRILAPNSRL
ncbi:MAG: pyridoxal-phosphate dependent enzyme [Cyanobacteria bacterium SZAS LIN-5]|nr:pyridoxal-phosphate dependent enzyme [Cyanobacteria bacterium SZAS LIN-5]